MKILSLILRIVIGSLFLLSGFSKLVNVQEFFNIALQYGIGMMAYLSVLIPPVEILLGLALIIGYRTGISGLITSLVTLVFTMFFIYGSFFGKVDDCGCFGSVLKLNMPAWSIYIRNLIIIIGGFMIYNVNDNTHRTWQISIIATLSMLVFTASGISMVSPFYSPEKIDFFIGKPLPIEISKTLKLNSRQTYALFIFSPKCAHCWDATANVMSLKQSGYVDEVIALTSDEWRRDVNSVYQRKFNTDFDFHYVNEKVFSKNFEKLPRVLIVKNLLLADVLGPTVPSGYTLTQH